MSMFFKLKPFHGDGKSLRVMNDACIDDIKLQKKVKIFFPTICTFCACALDSIAPADLHGRKHSCIIVGVNAFRFVNGSSSRHDSFCGYISITGDHNTILFGLFVPESNYKERIVLFHVPFHGTIIKF